MDKIESSMDKVYKVMVKTGATSKRKFLIENDVFAKRRVLITLLESVKNLKIYYKK